LITLVISLGLLAAQPPALLRGEFHIFINDWRPLL
jgi:hypothetical protein